MPDTPTMQLRGADAHARLFTTWFTSLAGGVAVDHAMTDEEFAARRSEPKAVCGAVVMFAPLESPPGTVCEACLGVLGSAASVVLSRHKLVAEEPHRLVAGLLSVVTRLHDAIACSPIGWNRPRNAPDGMQVRPFGASSHAAVAHTGDRSEPPTGMWTNLVPAGAPAGEGTAHVPSPAHVVSDTVTVTGARPAAQPSHPQSTGPCAVDAGLGGSQTAEVLQPRRVPLADCVPAAGAGQRHTPLPAAALSAATPEGRDRLDEATPHRAPARRLVQIHPTPTAAQLTPR